MSQIVRRFCMRLHEAKQVDGEHFLVGKRRLVVALPLSKSVELGSEPVLCEHKDANERRLPVHVTKGCL
jgi:hypothetical protein